MIVLAAIVFILASCQCSAEQQQRQHGSVYDAAAAKSAESVQNLIAILSDDPGAASLVTDSGESLLHLACIYGDHHKIEALLKAGADPNYRASKLQASLDMTPLTWCCYGGYSSAVKQFLADPRTNANLVGIEMSPAVIFQRFLSH